MAVSFAATTGVPGDINLTDITLDEAIKTAGEKLKEMLLAGNLLTTINIAKEMCKGPLKGADPHSCAALVYLQMCNQLNRRTGKDTELCLFPRPVHFGAAGVTRPMVDFVDFPFAIHPKATSADYRIRGTLSLDASLYPAMRVTSHAQPAAVTASPAAFQHLLPAVGSLLTLQSQGFSYIDEEAGHFSVWARREEADGWIPLGFWVVFRRDGVGSGADANNRAELGWQFVQASRAAAAAAAAAAGSGSSST